MMKSEELKKVYYTINSSQKKYNSFKEASKELIKRQRKKDTDLKELRSLNKRDRQKIKVLQEMIYKREKWMRGE